MPKRIFDGDAAWTSSKIAALEPVWVRPEYAWLHSLAGPNGVFEFDVRAIWARCYAFLRPEIGLPEVEIIFAAFHKTKLVFLWEQEGKQWAYWTNSDKPGRLPRKSWQKRYAKSGTLGPYPPEEALKKFMQEATARPSRASNTPEPCKPHASSVLGIGIGTGTGSGKTLSSEEKGSSDKRDPSKKSEKKTEPKRSQPSEAARRLAQLLLTRVVENFRRLEVKSKLLESEKEQQATVKRWARDIDLLLRRDHYSEAQVRELIEWCQADQFWLQNIRSGYKLRKQVEDLMIRMKSERVPKAGGSGPTKSMDHEFEDLARRRAGQVN